MTLSKLNFSKNWDRLKNYFLVESGGKRILALKRAGVYSCTLFALSTIVMAWFGPKTDRTFYQQTSERQKFEEDKVPGVIANAMAQLFLSGKRKQAEDKKNEANKKQRQASIRYLAPQVVGMKPNVPRSIRQGAKLVGFLLSAIDTRVPAPVRVRILQGGEVNGVAIEAGSVLTGQFSYSGTGKLLHINFSRIDTVDGEPKRIQAQALNVGNYSPGIIGEEHSDTEVKVAAQMGLTMFAGMTDVLTEKESLGITANGVQAKPTMKNALLQGLSKSAQDRANQTASEISSTKDYLTISEGKEMIIELTEDFK